MPPSPKTTVFVRPIVGARAVRRAPRRATTEPAVTRVRPAPRDRTPATPPLQHVRRRLAHGTENTPVTPVSVRRPLLPPTPPAARPAPPSQPALPPLPPGMPGWPLSMASALRPPAAPRAAGDVDTLEVLPALPARPGALASTETTGVITIRLRRRVLSWRNLAVWLVTLAAGAAGTYYAGDAAVASNAALAGAAALNTVWPR